MMVTNFQGTEFVTPFIILTTRAEDPEERMCVTSMIFCELVSQWDDVDGVGSLFQNNLTPTV